MPHNDRKYTSYLDIAQRLARTHPQKSNLLQPADVAAWCAECETEMIGDIESYRTYVDVELKVNSNRQVLIPCSIFKILDVYDRPGQFYLRIMYDDNGSYLSFSSEQTFPTNSDGEEIVYANLKGIAIDEETGYPLIKKGHEQACEAFCVSKIYYEDFISGKLSQQAWGEIQFQLSNALLTAKQPGRMDNQKQLELQHIRANMILRPWSIPIYNMNY